MKLKKIISILTIIISIFFSFNIFEQEVNAATYIIEEANLYSKGELVCFTYDGIKVGVEFVVYKKNGIEYPAYCLNRNLPGVTSTEGYTVKADRLVTDNKIWIAVVNGYPFKTAKELGCNSDIEAFAATKMAVYDAMYNYDWKKFAGLNSQGDRVVNAAEKIAKIARSSSQTKPVSIVNINQISEKWKLDNIDPNYISKEFEVEANLEYTKYTIKLNKLDLENVKIVDGNNIEKHEYKSGENFKILIPISQLDKSGELELEVTAEVKTKPILYGDSGDSSKQSYALVAGEYEFQSTKAKIKYLPNTTKIEIIKKDAETKELLKEAKFNILDENKKIVYSDVTTNEKGIAVVENIIPGKYYIQEVKSPDGYTIYDELIEIEIELNQKYTVNVNNYKKPENEDKIVEDENITQTGKKEINLPRTGF